MEGGGQDLIHYLEYGRICIDIKPPLYYEMCCNSVPNRGSREYRFRLGFAVPKWLVPDLVLISTKSEFWFWIWFCQESKLSFGFGFGFVKNQN